MQTAQININNAQLQFSQDLAGGNAQLLARGGTVYAKDGIELFKPKGTDTVPAMLTPGEVIVNNRGANAGNNRGLLRRMNNGEAMKFFLNFTLALMLPSSGTLSLVFKGLVWPRQE